MFTFAWSVERHNSQPEVHQTYTAEIVNKQTVRKEKLNLSAYSILRKFKQTLHSWKSATKTWSHLCFKVN